MIYRMQQNSIWPGWVRDENHEKQKKNDFFFPIISGSGAPSFRKHFRRKVLLPLIASYIHTYIHIYIRKPKVFKTVTYLWCRSFSVSILYTYVMLRTPKKSTTFFSPLPRFLVLRSSIPRPNPDLDVNWDWSSMKTGGVWGGPKPDPARWEAIFSWPGVSSMGELALQGGSR